MTKPLQAYCVVGKCMRKAVTGHWLCKECAEQNGGDALAIKEGQYPCPAVFFAKDCRA